MCCTDDDDDDDDRFDGLQPRAHFQTWLQAFSVMARSTTGENWHSIAYDLSSDVPGCVPLANATSKATDLYANYGRRRRRRRRRRRFIHSM